MNIICAVCGGKTPKNTYGQGSDEVICSEHASGWKYVNVSFEINGNTLSCKNGLLIGPINWGEHYYYTTTGNIALTVLHDRIYTLTCNKPLNGSATSVKF